MSSSDKRKKSQEQENNARDFHYRLLAERSFDLVLVQDIDRKIAYVNRVWTTTLGYTSEESVGKPVSDFVSPEYLQADKLRNKKRRKGETASFQYELELIAQDGEKIPIEAHSSPIHVENGEVIEIIIVAKDIREKKKTQAALIESEARYHDLFESAPVGIWEKDFSAVKKYIDGIRRSGVSDFQQYFNENPNALLKSIKRIKVIGINQTAAKLLGAKSKESFNVADLKDVFTNDSVRVFKEALLSLISGKKEFTGESTAKRLDGAIFHQSMHWNRLNKDEDDWSRIIVSTQDITELRKAESTLTQQLNELNVLQASAFACAQARDIDALIRQITNIIGNTLYPDIYGIFLADEKQENLTPHSSYSFFAEDKENDTLPFNRGLTGKAAITRKSIRVDDVRQMKEYHVSSQSIKSELCVPIKVVGKTLGVINVESAKPAYFSEADERLLGTIASQVATALQKLKSLATEKERRTVAETLQKVAAVLTTTLDSEKTIETILNELHSVIEFTSASIQLLRGNQLEIAGGRGKLVLETEKNRTFPYPGNNPNTIVLQTLRPYIIDDAQATYDIFREMTPIKSWLGVPLIVNGRAIGLLTLDSDKKSHFTPEDAELVASFAHHAAISLNNANLFEAEQKRREEAETLRETALALTSSLDLEDAIQQILEQLARVLSYDSAGIQILKGDYLVFVGGRGWENPEAVMNIHFSVPGNNPNSRVITEKKVVILKDALQAHAPFGEVPHSYIQSWMGIPMIFRNKVIGMLAVDSKEKNHFDESSAEIAQAFATQAAIVIENARLFDEERKRLKEAEMLREAAITINSALSLDAVLKTVAKQMANAIKANGCFVSRWDREKDALFVLVDHNQNHPELSTKPGTKHDLKTYPFTRSVLTSNDTILLYDKPEISFSEKSLLRDQGLSILLMLPLIASNKTIGMIAVYEEADSEREVYSEEEINLVRGLATHAALAVENARLYNAEKTRRQEAETLSQVAHTISSSLDLGEVLDTILSSIKRVVPFYSAAVLLSRQDKVEITRAYNLPEREKSIGKSFSSDNALYQEMCQKKHPVILDDAQQNPHFGGWSGTDYVHGWMGVPLIARGDVIGYITLDSKEVGAYQKKHAELAQVFAHQAASAITNARLYKKALQTAENRAVLHRVSQDISRGIQDPETIYQAVHQAAEKLMPCDAFVLSLRSQDELKDDFAVYLFDKGTRFPAKQVPRDESIIAIAKQEGGSLICNDINASQLNLKRENRFGSEERTRSMLISPMRSGNELVGAISVQSYQANVYTPEETVLLEMLAAHAVAAIKNARLLEEAEQRGREFAELYQVSQDLVTNQDTDLLLTAMLERATNLIGVSFARLYIYDENSAELVSSSFYGLNETEKEKKLGVRLKIGEGMAGKVAKSQTPMRINNYQNWEERSPKYDNILPFTSVLELPLIYRGNLLGVLGLFEVFPKTHYFSEDDERIMSLFAAQLASALHSAKQLEQITTRLAELEAINQLSTALRTTETPEEMLPILSDEINHSLHVEVCVIWMVAPHSDEIYRALVRGWVGNISPDRQKTDIGIIGHVFNTGKPYRSKNIAEDPYIKSNRPDLIPPNWMGLWVPIRASHAITGVMGIMAEAPREFGDGDLQILNIMAEIAGNAFHRARLHSRTEQQLKRLTALRNIDISISAHTELHLTLHLLIEQTIKQLDVEAADILLVEKTTKNLKFFIGNGFKDPNIKLTQLRANEGLPGKAIRQRSVLHSNSLDTEASRIRRNWFAEEGFHCYYCIPLNAKGNILGVLEVFKKTHIETPPEWMDYLETLAGQAAIAIDNNDLVEDLKQSNEELARAYDTTLEGWGKALELRDKETQGHTLSVTDLTVQLARYINMPESEIIHVYRGALLHDIGKMGIPDNILHKPGPLTKDEWTIMRQHPKFAYDMLSPIGYLLPAADIPYCHHERWDGTGYPRGLKEEEIPLAARIFSIIDVWDALLTDRPYRKAWLKQVVIEYIRNESGSRFDPKIVANFIEMISQENN